MTTPVSSTSLSTAMQGIGWLISRQDVGMTVYRDLKVSDGRLTIQLETTTLEGEAIIRTLVWEDKLSVFFG